MDRINLLKGLKPTPEEIHRAIVSKYPRLDEGIYEQGPWTGIKLSIIAYYTDIYTNIIKKHFPPNICYIDALAGSGIVRIDKDIYLFGSPIIAILAPKEKFDRYIFIEKSRNRGNYLRKVVNYLSNSGLVDRRKITLKIESDMNDINYEELMKEYKCTHSLVFVDPESFEVHWSTMEKLLSLKNDIIFNFMTGWIRRSWGSVRKSEPFNYTQKLNLFFGDKTWMRAEKGEDLLEIYINKIQSYGRIVRSIRVNVTHSNFYDILIIVRPTSSGNPWLKAVDNLKKRIEKTSRTTFERLLKIIEKKQATVDNFF